MAGYLGPDSPETEDDSGSDQELMGDITNTAAQAKAALQKAQQRLMSLAAVSPEEQSADEAAALMAPTRTGNFGDSLANLARARAADIGRNREMQMLGAEQGVGFTKDLMGIDQDTLGARLRLAQMQQARRLAQQQIAVHAPEIAAQTRAQQADAALKEAEAKNPQLFHPSLFGGSLDDDHQQKLQALEAAGVIDPQHISRYNANPGAIDAAYNTLQNNQGFTGTAHQTIAASEKDFLSNGTQSSGGKITRGNAAMNHIQALRELAAGMNNGDVRLWNRAKAALGIQLGDPSPQNLQLAAHFVGSEVTSYLSAAGGTQGDRDEVAKRFSVANSPAQAAGAADTAEGLMAGQFDALRQKYRSRPDKPSNFSERFLTPESRAALARFDAARAARTGSTTPAVSGGTDIAALARAELARRQSAGGQ